MFLGATWQAMHQPERKLRIAVWRKNYFRIPVHTECLEAVDKTAKACEDHGTFC